MCDICRQGQEPTLKVLDSIKIWIKLKGAVVLRYLVDLSLSLTLGLV